MLKRLPDLKTDEEAERFVATADLSEYDLSSFAPARFRFAPQDAAREPVTLPADLLRRVDAEAEKAGTSRDDFIRRALEDALGGLAA